MAKQKWRWLPKRHYTNLSLLLLRIVSGGLMLTHGIPKFDRLIAGKTKFADPIGLGEEFTLILTVFAEVLCAGLVAIGLFTRAAVIPLIVTMLVAAFIVHGDDPFARKELPLMYVTMYLLLYFKGPGDLSLDKVLNR